MKLRIKGNSVRLRLTKSDVEKLCTAAYLEDKTSFGETFFTYSIESRDCKELTAEFKNNKMTVYIPSSFTNGWNNNETVGFENNISLNNGEQLHILIEKDFKCLDETTEDQSDNFENPHITCQE